MPARHEPAPVAAGRLLGGRYRLTGLIAKGGMAEVWQGYDEVLTRSVAVKILHPHLAGDGLFLERFRREAVTAAGIADPGVVSTFDTGIDDGTAYIVMELVKGRTLRQYLRDEGVLPVPIALAIARQIAEALAHAHRAGLVHRDVKPANVLLVEDGWSTGRVKVTDFGISKAGAGVSELTRTGTVLGTPKYLAPEQVRGEEPDSRADLYALGVVIYEMLAGVPPFRGDTDMATALAHINEPVPKLATRGIHVPAGVESLVNDLLAKDRTRRIQTADDLLRRLDALGAPSAHSHTNGAGRPKEPPRARMAPPARGNHSGGPTGRTAVEPARPAAIAAPAKRKAAKRRSLRTPTLIVAGLVLVAGIATLSIIGADSAGREPGAGTTGGSSLHIANVAVWMVDFRAPDDPGGTRYTFDGNPSTYWETDQYPTATFGGLYPGIGLEIHLASAGTVHDLVVSSPSRGWSAQTYVSEASHSSGQPVSVWGAPTDTRHQIAGDVTFKLSSKRASWVLLWLTNLGPTSPHQVMINELAVS